MKRTYKNRRIRLIPAYLKYTDHWDSGYEKLDGNIPTHGIYESETTHERYKGYVMGRHGSTVPPDFRHFINLEPIEPTTSEIKLTEGEILKLIKVLPL